jgi:hypothetical protein
MSIEPQEIEIVGTWFMQNGRMMADDACQRIDSLIKSELVSIASANGGWDQLYRDPNDGRYWERTFSQSEMQGGGPPTLRFIDFSTAAQKYGKPEIEQSTKESSSCAQH